MTVPTDYVLSFTAAGLMRVPSANMAALRLKLGDWPSARMRGLEENLLQARTPTTGRRIWRELEARLSSLPLAALQLLVDGTASQQAQILWLALCTRYSLVAEFAVEVLREAALFGRRSVLVGDVEAFLHHKASASPKISHLAMTETVRIRRTLLRMGREAGFLDDGDLAHPQLPDLEVARAMGAAFLPVWPTCLLTDSGLMEVRGCL